MNICSTLRAGARRAPMNLSVFRAFLCSIHAIHIIEHYVYCSQIHSTQYSIHVHYFPIPGVFCVKCVCVCVRSCSPSHCVSLAFVYVWFVQHLSLSYSAHYNSCWRGCVCAWLFNGDRIRICVDVFVCAAGTQHSVMRARMETDTRRVFRIAYRTSGIE